MISWKAIAYIFLSGWDFNIAIHFFLIYITFHRQQNLQKCENGSKWLLLLFNTKEAVKHLLVNFATMDHALYMETCLTFKMLVGLDKQSTQIKEQSAVDMIRR